MLKTSIACSSSTRAVEIVSVVVLCIDVVFSRFGVVEVDVGARVGVREEVVLERDEVEVLVGGADNEPDAAAVAARLSRSEHGRAQEKLRWTNA